MGVLRLLIWSLVRLKNFDELRVVLTTLSNWWEVIYGFCRLDDPNHLTAEGWRARSIVRISMKLKADYYGKKKYRAA